MALRNLHLLFSLALFAWATLILAVPTPQNLEARPDTDNSGIAQGEKLEAIQDDEDVDRYGYYNDYGKGYGKGYGYYGNNYGYGKGYGKGYGYYDNYGYDNGYGKGYYNKGYGYYY